MNKNQIIEAITGLVNSFLEQNIPPKHTEPMKNGEKFVWKVTKNIDLILEQYDNPPNVMYRIEAPKFILTLFEDAKSGKYTLDTEKIEDEEYLAKWLYATWIKNKKFVHLDKEVEKTH